MRFKLVLDAWTRFVSMASVTALIVVAVSILIEIDGWVAYDTGPQLAVDIGARVAIALAFAMICASVAVCLALPYIFGRSAGANERYVKVLRVTTLTVIAVSGSAIIGMAIRWASAVGLWTGLTNRASIHLWAWLSGIWAVSVATVHILWKREHWVDRCAQSISGRATRRMLLLAGVGGLLAGLSVGTDRRPSSVRVRPSKASAGRPNVVLVTFDALSAEDMSCYGYRLPTTPNVDLLAQSSYVLPNYYAVSTFTTPCIASMFTGCYPSTNHVYHYGGSLHGNVSERTLSKLLRTSGYATAASVANPGAHPACLGFGEDFDILPTPPLTDFAMRAATTLFRSAQLADDIRRDVNFVPYMLEQWSPRTFGQVHSIFPPRRSFQQAAQMLRDLPSPFFLWVHALAPHFPYLPESPFLRRFLPTDELRTHAEFADLMDRTGYAYSPAKQPSVDKGRLRYDEWVAEADDAFGEFMKVLRASGRFDNTAVIVSSDHGESFDGGYLGHGGAQQLRPILHVPLVVHLPGQMARRDIDASVDQTLLAPTILELVGISRPDWMTGPTLQSLARGDIPGGTRAFAQFLVANSAFRPVTHGSIGVIDGCDQFVLDLDSNKGALFDLAEAHEQRLDRSAAEPALAMALRARIEQRFPEIFRRRAAQA
jgi:arylsulfatase A-like enzyme